MKLISIFLCLGLVSISSLYAQSKHTTIDLDQPRPYMLQLISVEAYPKKNDGKDWDLLGATGPDLFVQVFVDDHQVLLSKVHKDTFVSTWTHQVSQAFALTASSKIKIVVWDKDLKDDDLVGEPSFTPTLDQVKAAKTFRLEAGRVKEVKVRLFEKAKIKDLIKNKAIKTVKGSESKKVILNVKKPAQPLVKVPVKKAPVKEAPVKEDPTQKAPAAPAQPQAPVPSNDSVE